MIVWSDCKCPRTHASHRDLLRCKFALMHPERINGSGPHVAIKWCKPATLFLYLTQDQARSRLKRDLERCGPDCDPNKHQLGKVILTR